MPIDYSIDNARRLVVARGSGAFTPEEVFAYQREVWSRPDVAGYDELVDMTGVETVVEATSDNIWQLAELAAGMDSDSSRTTKMAIVAPQDLLFGLGRMFDAYRNADRRSNKEVRVFRTIEEAMVFLGVDGTL